MFIDELLAVLNWGSCASSSSGVMKDLVPEFFCGGIRRGDGPVKGDHHQVLLDTCAEEEARDYSLLVGSLMKLIPLFAHLPMTMSNCPPTLWSLGVVLSAGIGDIRTKTLIRYLFLILHANRLDSERDSLVFFLNINST